MGTEIYGVVRYVNKFQLDKTGKRVVRQIGKADPGTVIAFSKSVEGALRFLEAYVDDEYDSSAQVSDKLVAKSRLTHPKRRLAYNGFNDSGPVRYLVSLAIVTKKTILSNCL